MTTLPDHETKSFFAADKRLLFILLCLASIFLLYVKIVLIENETAAFEFLQDRPEGAILSAINALKFLGIPLVYLWKFTIIGFTIWVGCFMFGYRVTYAQCWGIVLVAEYVFLLPELAKILYFLFVIGDPTYHEILYWFILVQGIHRATMKDKKYVWIIVSCSYILLFFLWLLFYTVVYK